MIGRTLNHYRILRLLGRGGMGEVFLAEDLRLERKLALKLLPPVVASDPGTRRRFEREARALAALNHPHVVTIHSVEEAEGLVFITMELVEGDSLADLIPESGLPTEKLDQVARTLVDALAAVHARGVTHGDLKPANIKVTPDGRLKILDFGLARMERRAGAPQDTIEATMTAVSTSAFAGTPAYMAPEQIAGRPVDPRCDVFSLGIVLFELATGRRPFTGETPAEVMASILRDPAPRVSQVRPDLSAGLSRVLMRCLEKEPERRYPSARDLLAELESAAQSTGPVAGDAVDVAALIESGRKAYARENWREAVESLNRADVMTSLSADDLEKLSEAAWWIGQVDDCIKQAERAYRSFEAEQRPERAAYAALVLAEAHFDRRVDSVGRGWLKRAQRILESLPETVVHGYSLRLQTKMVFEGQNDLEQALDLARRTAAIAERFQDRDLQALARQDQGRVLVSMGQVDAGMELLDEAMTAAVSGELKPTARGTTYCNMIGTCRKLTDYRRAAEWSEAARDWCDRKGGALFPGICRVYRSEILRLHGAWSGAEQEARRACDETEQHIPDVAAEAFYQIGEIRLRLGDVAGAEEAFRRAHALGRTPVPGLALLRLSQGETRAAVDLLEASLADTTLPRLDRAGLLPAAVEVLLAAGQAADAERAAQELRSIADLFGSVALQASAAYAVGLLKLAGGPFEESIRELRLASKLYQELDLPYEAARVRVSLARAYRSSGREEMARLELESAVAGFQGLGAEPDVRIARDLLAASG